MHLVHGGGVNAAVGMAGVQVANVVRLSGQVGHQVAHPQARLAVPLEGPGAGQAFGVALGELAHRLAEGSGQGLPPQAGEFGLGVEQVHGARAADHEHEDDRLGAGGEVRFPGGKGVRRLGVAGHQVRQGHAHAGAA